MQRQWKSTRRRDVSWLNEPGPKELAMTQVAYDTGIGVWYYSHAAVLIKVPAFYERKVTVVT